MLAKLLQEMILTLADEDGTKERRYSLRASEVELLKNFIESAPESGGLGKTNFLSQRDDGVQKAERKEIIDELVQAALIDNDYAIDISGMSSRAREAITNYWFDYPGDPTVIITTKFDRLLDTHYLGTKTFDKTGGVWTISQAKRFLQSARFVDTLKKVLPEASAKKLQDAIDGNLGDLSAEKSYRNLLNDPTYSTWYERLAPLLEGAGKLGNFVGLLKRCKKSIGGTNYFSSIVDALMDIPDEILVESLFSFQFEAGSSYQIPQEWRVIADINAYNSGGSAGHSVGRGEFVIPFLSETVTSIAGKNVNYDLDIGGALWEVKYVDKTKLARLSGNAFAASTVMEVLRNTEGWVGSDTTSFSIELIEKNREIIERVYGNMPNFHRRLTEEMHVASLQHVTGIIFMNSKYELKFVATPDVEFVRGANGAYIASWERPSWVRSL